MQFDSILPVAPTPRAHVRLASFLAGTPASSATGPVPFFRGDDVSGFAHRFSCSWFVHTLHQESRLRRQRLFDYFGIALWGLSADVAQRKLQCLQLPK
jgi:hypothetical protein